MVGRYKRKMMTSRQFFKVASETNSSYSDLHMELPYRSWNKYYSKHPVVNCFLLVVYDS